MQKTERHNESEMMASFEPEGYSASSEGLSNASASLIAVVWNPDAWLAPVAMRERVLGFSLSSSFFSLTSFFSSRSEVDVLSEVGGGIADAVGVRSASGVVETFDFKNGNFMVCSCECNRFEMIMK